MHYCPLQSNFRGGRVPRVPRGIYATAAAVNFPFTANDESVYEISQIGSDTSTRDQRTVDTWHGDMASTLSGLSDLETIRAKECQRPNPGAPRHRVCRTS